MNRLLGLFAPSIFADSIFEVNEYLFNPRIKLILLDIDNTIIPYEKKIIPSSYRRWLISASKKKEIVFVTNNNRRRVEEIAELKNFRCICRAKKPLPFCFLKLLNEYNIKKHEAIVIGDQVLDDILGGNLAGICTVLVKPLKTEPVIRIRIKRYFESLLLNKIIRKKEK